MHTSFANEPDISSIQPDRLIKCRVSEDRFSAEVLLPGLSYTDFDQKIGGKLNLWSIAKVFESLRYEVFLNGLGHYDKLKDNDHSVFMASCSYHLTEKGNLLNAISHWRIKYPLYAKVHISYVGSSSYSFEIEVSSHQTGDLLMKSYCTFVYVSYKTHKPVTFPHWFAEWRKGRLFGHPQTRMAIPVIQFGAFQIQVKSSYSDTDQNGHVNHSIYLKWCSDAGTEAALNGHYFRFQGNIGMYPVDSINVNYISEGLVNKNFIIFTWQDTLNPLILHFQILQFEQICFVAQFLFKSSVCVARM